VPPVLLEHPQFARFWLGQTISLFGDQITFIALPLVGVLVLHAGAAEMGYLTAAGWAPYLFFALHAGAWVDRRGRRRRTMIAADLGRAVLLATVPVAYALDVLTIGQLYAVAFAAGTLSVLFFVSYNTLFVSVVPRERYVEANSALHGSRALSFVGGPSLGGFLVQLLTAPFTLVADAVSFLASAFFLVRISPEEPPTEEPARGHLLGGARYIVRSSIVRASLAAAATINFFNFVFWALFILYATRSLHVRPAVLGLVLGVGAFGGVLGSVVTGRLSRRFGVGWAAVAGAVLFPAPLVLVPLAGGPHPLVLAMLFLAEFGSGLGVVILDISFGSIQQAVIPDRLRARVAGAFMLVNFGVRPLGSLVGGALGSALGLRPTLWIAALGAIAGFVWLLPSPIPRLRELPAAAE
jgi:MFS family permease